MRIRGGSSSPWSDDDANDSALTVLFDDTPHLRHSRKPQPPSPPPPPPSTDPASYFTGVESGVVWKASLTASTTDSAGNLNVSFSFPNAASDYGRGYSEANKFVAFNGTEAARFVDVVNQVNGYLSGLNLIQNTGTSDSTADIRIAKTVTTGADAWAYYPNTGKGGDAWFNRNDSGATFGGKGGMNWDPAHLTPGDYTYTVLMHEFGHSLGLKHSFESGGVAGAVPHAFDSEEYTLMSYDAYQATPYNSTVDAREWWADDGNNPTTFMMLDIAALQHMYGADYTTNAGNTIYDVHDGVQRTSAGKIFMTLWDGGGIDTYDLSDYSVGVSIDLQPGHWVTISSTTERADLLAGTGEVWATGNIANAIVIAGVNNDAAHPDAGYIENAIGGSGNDILIGNIKANVLTGGAGNDIFLLNSLAAVDTVTDLIIGEDKLEFAASIFTKLTPVGGTLDASEFALTSAADTNDFIIYDAATGALSYDSDGNGSGSAIQVAILGNHPGLSSSDIQIA